MKRTTLKLSTAAVLMGLTLVFTAFLSFPVPKLQGAYVHLGDTVVFICACFLGGWYGAAVGGIGGALADLIVYPVYAPATLIIKALMGLTAGILLKNAHTPVARILAMLIPGLIMVFGYFIFEWQILKIDLIAEYTMSIPFNLLQATSSIVAASICIPLLEKSALIKRLYQ